MDQLIVPSQFNGPPRSANGGYASGLLAHALATPGTSDYDGPGPVEVSLRRPPPLDVAMDVRREADGVELGVELWSDGELVAAARTVGDDLDAVPPVDLDAAQAASRSFPGHGFHPFPTCFACGVERPDGLRVFPGEVEPGDGPRDRLQDGGATRVAAVWTPGAEVAADWHEYDDPTERCSTAATWAALDCIGGWSVENWAGHLGERLMVLGRMTAALDTLPAVGEPHVVMGQALGGEGRRTFTASTLYDPDGRIVGRARHVWVAVDPSTFNA